MYTLRNRIGVDPYSTTTATVSAKAIRHFAFILLHIGSQNMTRHNLSVNEFAASVVAVPWWGISIMAILRSIVA